MSEEQDWARELRWSWPVLRAESTTSITTAPMAIDFEGERVRIGVDGLKRRHLLVPILPDDEVPGDLVDGALSTGIRSYSFDGRRAIQVLDVTCSRSDLFDLFDELLTHTLHVLAAESTRPATVAQSDIGRWRVLLENRRRRVLSVPQQMGLIGELTILEIASGDQAVDPHSWRGPLREPHDIVLSNCALEVKTIGVTSSHFEIHGLRQLEPPEVPLALVVVTLTESSAGRPLPAVFDRMLATCSDPHELQGRIALTGYHPDDSERYNTVFEVVEVRYLEVDETTPRIVPSSFVDGAAPSGIDHVTYRVDLMQMSGSLISGIAALAHWVGAAGR